MGKERPKKIAKRHTITKHYTENVENDEINYHDYCIIFSDKHVIMEPCDNTDSILIESGAYIGKVPLDKDVDSRKHSLKSKSWKENLIKRGIEIEQEIELHTSKGSTIISGIDKKNKNKVLFIKSLVEKNKEPKSYNDYFQLKEMNVSPQIPHENILDPNDIPQGEICLFDIDIPKTDFMEIMLFKGKIYFRPVYNYKKGE